MKIWNRFISFALATTLLLTVPLVSFAAGTKNSTSSDFTTVQSASGELLVRAYDLDNGDSVFEQYNDGKLVSRYTVDRSKNVINELVYSSDGTSKQLQRFIPTEKSYRNLQCRVGWEEFVSNIQMEPERESAEHMWIM